MTVICLRFIQKDPQNTSFSKIETQLPARQDKVKPFAVTHEGRGGRADSYSQEDTTKGLLSGVKSGIHSNKKSLRIFPYQSFAADPQTQS